MFLPPFTAMTVAAAAMALNSPAAAKDENGQNHDLPQVLSKLAECRAELEAVLRQGVRASKGVFGRCGPAGCGALCASETIRSASRDELRQARSF